MANNGILSRPELIEAQKVQALREVAQAMRSITEMLRCMVATLDAIEKKQK